MAEFLLDNRNFFLTEPPVAPKSPTSTYTLRQRKADLVQTTGLNREQIDSLTDENGNPVQPLSYKSPVESKLNLRFEEGAPLEVLEDQASKEEMIRAVAARAEMLSAVDYTNANDDRVSATHFKTQRRLEQLSAGIMDKIEESSDNGFDTVTEFLDDMAYSTYAGVRDIFQGFSGGGTEQTFESDKIQLAASTMTDEEFDVFYQDYIRDTFEKGLVENLGNVNKGYGYAALAAIDGAGVIMNDREWGYANSAFAALDVATLGLSGATKVAKIGRSVVGRLRNSAGTVVATDAANSTALVLRTGLDGEVLQDSMKITDYTSRQKFNPTDLFGGRSRNLDTIEEAELVDDMIPEAFASTLNPRRAPPVSAASVKNTWTTNKYTSMFLKQEKAHAFGPSYIVENSQAWALNYAQKLAEASSTKMMSFNNLADEGLQNFRLSATFGRNDGMPFKTFSAAQKEMAKFPNSVIIDSRTGKVVTSGESGEFVIQSETRVPYGEVVGAMDLTPKQSGNVVSKLMNTFHLSPVGRVFAAAHYGSSSYLSNLADSAEYGSLGFGKTLEPIFERIQKLAGNELETMNKVLTTLRDAPTKGSSKSWLSTDEFIQNFKALEGKPPSYETIEAYQDAIRMSDFSWYVAASDRLRAMASQEASMVNLNGVRTIVYPTSKTVKGIKESGIQTWAIDLSTGKRVSVNGLDEDTPIMSFGHRQKDYSDYVVNFAGKTSLPELEDAFPYNAGGPRTNPALKYFVGDTSNGWATLIGTRTEKEAKLAKAQFDTVAKELQRILGDADITTLSKADRNKLNVLIAKNNNWNTSIETIDDFVEFAKSRGVNPLKEVFSKERDERLATFKSIGDGINDPHLLDMSVEKYSSYSRHDIALREFGGELTSNPEPILAVTNQFMNMVSRAAQTQYRMEATSSWVKAIEQALANGDIASFDIPLAPMTDEAKVYNYVIKGNTQAAKALRREQSIIQRRLNMYAGMMPEFEQTINRMADSSLEAIRDAAIKKTGKKKGSKDVAKAETRYDFFESMLGRPLDSASSTLTSLGFYQKMASPDQIVIQAAHIATVVSISPKNGAVGGVLAGFIRQAARSGDTSAWKILEGRLAKFAGLSPEKNKALMQHMFDSGRGYMRGAVAEDVATGFGRKNLFDKVKDVARVPFYAGENFSATGTRITAWLDIADKYPDLAYDSKEFLNKVVERDRTISFAMNSAQRSLAQAGPISRVATQWSAYPIRAIETIIFGDLTPTEKVRMAGVQAMLWGFAGLGAYEAGANLAEMAPDWMSDIIVKGVGDTLLEETLGIQLGSRIGLDLVGLMERARAMATLDVSVVPAFKLTGDTASSTLSALMNFGTGYWSLGMHNLETLGRAWKVTDNVIMAYEMAMHDVRYSNKGVKTEGPFTTSQEFFQFLGIAPAEAINEANLRNLSFNLGKDVAKVTKTLLPSFKEAIEQAEKGNYNAANSLIVEIDARMSGSGLTEVEMRSVKDRLFRESDSEGKTERVLKILILNGYTKVIKE